MINNLNFQLFLAKCAFTFMNYYEFTWRFSLHWVKCKTLFKHNCYQWNATCEEMLKVVKLLSMTSLSPLSQYSYKIFHSYIFIFCALCFFSTVSGQQHCVMWLSLNLKVLPNFFFLTYVINLCKSRRKSACDKDLKNTQTIYCFKKNPFLVLPIIEDVVN